MLASSGALDQVVRDLVPSLSRSLAEQFNVFRVMHHGTHEKQLSNVFAWLLRPDGTHELGDAFQRILMGRVNLALPAGSQLPSSGYRVVQEVDTGLHDGLGRDIADIVLSRESASVVVENFESSDGHGHDYQRYLAHGAQGGRQSVVVLLCARRESGRQTGGWEQAHVVTYAELLDELKVHVDGDLTWQRGNPEQCFFVRQIFNQFLEGPSAMNNEDRSGFIKTMCETGESSRYGRRPQEAAALEFAELVAQHAKRQFEEGRATLAGVKRALKQFAAQTLISQVNEMLQSGLVTSVEARFVGQWEWCVTLSRSDPERAVFLEFGPTAAVENRIAPQPLVGPDYSKIFVTRQAAGREGIDLIVQTDVGLEEVLLGLSIDDLRLRDGILMAVGAS